MHDVAPVKSLKVPASQSKQLDCPVVSWYLPATQSSHSVNPVELDNRPAAHSEQLDAPVSSPYLPASHEMHESSPTSAYLPTGQSSHPFPSGTVPDPQDVQLVAPALLYVPFAHSRQLD